MMYCTNCGMQLEDGTRFCPGCGTALEAPQQPQQYSAPQQQYAAPQQYSAPPQQYAAPRQPKKKKGGLIALLVILAVLLVAAVAAVVLFLTGGDPENPDLGKYNAVSCVAAGMELGAEDEWILLKDRGRATLVLLGDEYSCKWELEGDDFTLIQHGDEFSGTLEDGILILDFGGMVYTYVQEPTEFSPGGHLHQWQEADCIHPKTCACGETEGAPLGHSAEPANYQESSVCSVCGVQLEDKLQPDFERHGLTTFAQMGVTYPYTTCCSKNESFMTTGEATIVSYVIFNSSDTMPAVEGYEYRQVVAEVVVGDQNARSYGAYPAYNYEDYYNIALLDDQNYYDEANKREVFTVSYYGEERLAYLYVNYDWEGWHWENGKKIDRCFTTYTFLVPVGYDGCVFGVYNRVLSGNWGDGMYINDFYTPEDFILFRLD